MNVVLLVIDTLRADHLGCYGYSRATSPHIDRFASEGTLFNQMIAPHIPTTPSFTTMFTGRDVMSHQIITHGSDMQLDEKIPVLAEILSNAGYHTAAADNLGRWFQRGFDDYRRYAWMSEPGEPDLKAEAVSDVALPLLESCADQDKPFFLFLHYWDPHTPYKPPEPFKHMFYRNDQTITNPGSLKGLYDVEPFGSWFGGWMEGAVDIDFPTALYDGEIAYVDAYVQQFFTRLTELGLDEDTVVILTSDHGETMDEHGCFFDHHGLYDANVNIPLIVRCPGTVPERQRLDGMVATFDIAPTILDYAGLGEEIANSRMFGRSVRPLLEHGSHGGNHETVYLTECTWMRKRGIRTNDWKYIRSMQPDFHNLPPVELYDLREKPVKEVTNMVDIRQDVAKDLDAAMDRWVGDRLAATGGPDPLVEQDITLGKQYTK
jgi:arylsulfatase A-like enzyme